MDIQFCITAQEADSLKVSITGSGIEVAGLPCGRKVSFEGEFDVAFRLLPAEEVRQEVVEAVQDVEAVAEVQPEAAVTETQELFTQLVALRKQIASEVKLPPYIIFHDSTLRDMCSVLPVDLQSLKGIQGVGAAKLEKYGSRFVEFIRRYAASAERVA